MFRSGKISLAGIVAAITAFLSAVLILALVVFLFQMFLYTRTGGQNPLFSPSFLIRFVGFGYENIGVVVFGVGLLHLFTVVSNNNIFAYLSGLYAKKYILWIVLCIILAGCTFFFTYTKLIYMGRLIFLDASELGRPDIKGSVGYFHFLDRVFFPIDGNTFLFAGRVFFSEQTKSEIIMEDMLIATPDGSLQFAAFKVKFSEDNYTSFRKEFTDAKPKLQIVEEKIPLPSELLGKVSDKMQVCRRIFEPLGFANLSRIRRCAKNIGLYAPRYLTNVFSSAVQLFMGIVFTLLLYTIILRKYRTNLQNYQILGIFILSMGILFLVYKRVLMDSFIL